MEVVVNIIVFFSLVSTINAEASKRSTSLSFFESIENVQIVQFIIHVVREVIVVNLVIIILVNVNIGWKVNIVIDVSCSLIFVYPWNK